MICALLLLAAAIDDDAAKQLTTAVRAQVAAEPTLELVPPDRVFHIVSLNADCAETTSCLVEVAKASDARFVLFGELAERGPSAVLSIGAFDARDGVMAPRVSFPGEDAADIEALLADRKAELLAGVLDRRGGVADGVRTKVLVLDVRARHTRTHDAPPPPGRTPWLLIAGGVGAGLGLAAIGVGAFVGVLALQADQRAQNPDTTQADAAAAYEERDGYALVANAFFLGGGMALVAGGALAAAGVISE